MPRTRVGRDALLVLLCLPTLVAVGLLGQTGDGLFPQQYSHEFYVAKGLVGLVAVVLLIVHMSQSWERTGGTGQRLRYLALLVGTVSASSASTTQFADDFPVLGLNLAGFLFVLVVALAAAVSLIEDARRP